MAELPDLRVAGVQTWPDVPAGVTWAVLDADGVYGRKLARVGAEVDLCGTLRPENGPIEHYVIALQFPTLAQAERAGKILADALAAMDAIRDEVHPTPDDGHEHVFEKRRYSRSSPEVDECGICHLILEPEKATV